MNLGDVRHVVCIYCGAEIMVALDAEGGELISIENGDTARDRGAVCKCGCVIVGDGEGGIIQAVPEPWNGRPA